jgi:hypothetical protein
MKKKVHLVEAEFDSCASLVEVVRHGIPLKGILMDGGVGINVMIVSTMETLGLQCDGQSSVVYEWLIKKG